MNNTPKRNLPYPSAGDPPDGAAQIGALALALDGEVARPVTALPVGEVGQVGQIRAGRQLALADFTALGLSAPAGLWNLSDLTDASGNGRNLSNKGAVPFGVGINGLAATSAVFAGSAAQALYIADTGAADPFRIRTGSWGCWFRVAKRGAFQTLISKFLAPAPGRAWYVLVSNANVLHAVCSTDGTVNSVTTIGTTDVADDRWHCTVTTYDGATLRLYLDGALEGASSATGAIFGSAAPLNIGNDGADGGASGGNSYYGRIDEAFVTPDVLSPDQIRALYCARIPHALGAAPKRASLNVTRRRRGAPLLAGDFPTQPLRLHNFTGGSLADEGSGGVALANPSALVSVAGPDGATAGAMHGSGGGGLTATDAGLPAALTARSYGCWFKTATTGLTQCLIAWGTYSSGDARFQVAASSVLQWVNASDSPGAGPFVADGQWHHAVSTEDNAASDGVRRKFYVDGRLVGGSTVMNAVVLAGATKFRVGADSTGISPLTGQIDGAFVCGYALTIEQITALYNKSAQAFAPSPQDASPFIEAFNAADVLAAFDGLSGNPVIDLGVTT